MCCWLDATDNIFSLSVLTLSRGDMFCRVFAAHFVTQLLLQVIKMGIKYFGCSFRGKLSDSFFSGPTAVPAKFQSLRNGVGSV